MPEALYYPWIDVRSDSWLKTSLLYWDVVRTIVPESIEEPYRSHVGRELQQAQFLVPVRVHSSMDEVESLTEDTLAYLATREGGSLLLSDARGEPRYIHVEKLPYELGRIARIHPEKFPWEIRNLLREFAERRGSEWLEVDDGFANFYMTLLATRLSERLGISLLTPLPSADSLAVAARFDAQVEGLIPLGMNAWRPAREYAAFGRRRNMPRDLAAGLLAHLAIERVAVAPDTPLEKLLAFRERYRDELALFRTKILALASTVAKDQPMEAMREQVADLYAREVAPAFANLKRSLKGQRIKALSEGLLKVAFLSTAPTSALVIAGMAAPTALLAGAGISLVVAGTLYNVERRESLQANPFAYLLAVERDLA